MPRGMGIPRGISIEFSLRCVCPTSNHCHGLSPTCTAVFYCLPCQLHFALSCQFVVEMLVVLEVVILTIMQHNHLENFDALHCQYFHLLNVVVCVVMKTSSTFVPLCNKKWKLFFFFIRKYSVNCQLGK